MIMLAAVDFDDQFVFETHEIDDILPDLLLPPEFAAIELFSPKLLPQNSFGNSAFSPEHFAEVG
jgi:hypothetical protein